MADRVKVVAVVQTCGMCPSQWEGIADDGREVYARYRHGRLYVGIGATLDDAVMAGVCGRGEMLYEGDHGDEWGGYMTFDEMARHTAHVLDWPVGSEVTRG